MKTHLLKLWLLFLLLLSSLVGWAEEPADAGNPLEAAKRLGEQVDTLRSTAKDLQDKIDKWRTFTTPVMLKGGSGKSYLELSVDTIRYARQSEQDGAITLDAHADFQLPFSVAGNMTSIGFIGKNIVLAGDGNSRILLDSEGRDFKDFLMMDGKARLRVNKESYVEFDCNGFREMHLEGEFRFDSTVIYSAQMDKDSVMAAKFNIIVADLEDILIVTGFDRPFKVRGTGDVVYTAYDLVADLSTVRNASGFEFPEGYRQAFKDDDKDYWTGFAMKTLKVDFNRELPVIDSLDAYNMLIDETGFSGYVSAGFTFGEDRSERKDVVQNIHKDSVTSPDPMGNNFVTAKISKLAVTILSGRVTKGELDGTMMIRGLKDRENGNKPMELTLKGAISTVRKDSLVYNFSAVVKTGKRFELPVLDTAYVIVGPGTSVEMWRRAKNDSTKEMQNGFALNLCGSATFNCKLLKMDSLSFQNVKFSTNHPYFSGGNWSLGSINTMQLHGLPISLTHLRPQFIQDSLLDFNTGVMLKLIADGKGASVAAGFDMFSNVLQNWKVKGLRVNDVSVDMDFSAFHLKGDIKVYKDHEVYGDGFEGNLNLGVKAINLNVEAAAKFGKTSYNACAGTSPYRYWYAFANVDLPSGTLIFPPAVMLKSVSLAVYSKLSYEFDPEAFIQKGDTGRYYPDCATAFGFKGGIGICIAKDKLVEAKVRLGMEFSQSGGIKNVGLDGRLFMLASEEKNAMVKGALNCKYDFENRILHVLGVAEANLARVLKGKATLSLHSDPKGWYFNLGTVDKPNNLKFAGFASATSYFMMGDSVPTYLPPLAPEITKEFNIVQSTASGVSRDEFSSGRGFAFGVSLDAHLQMKKFIYADVRLLGGTDALVVRTDGVTCAETKYRSKGRAYVYVNMEAGVKPYRRKYSIIKIAAASELYAEFPKPYYVEGRILFHYRLLGGRIKGSANAKYKGGSKCNPVGDGYEEVNPDGIVDFDDYEDLKNLEDFRNSIPTEDGDAN